MLFGFESIFLSLIFQTQISDILLNIPALDWLPLEADPETRTRVQVVYSGGGLPKILVGDGGSETEKGRRQRMHWKSSSYCRQLELNAPEKL